MQSYNEPGWTNRDVEAIVKARESTKQAKDCEFIGEKGQGFYSVFRIAVEAIILSGQMHRMTSDGKSLTASETGNSTVDCRKMKYPVGGYFFKLGRKPCEHSGFQYVNIVIKTMCEYSTYYYPFQLDTLSRNGFSHINFRP